MAKLKEFCKRGHKMSETRMYFGVDKKKSKCGECYRQKLCPSKQRPTYLEWRLQRYYGISVADFEAMILKQEGVCAICGTARAGRWGGTKYETNLYIDHDHGSGRVRGLLCNMCNLGLGKFDEDPIRLRKAATYIEIFSGGPAA